MTIDPREMVPIDMTGDPDRRYGYHVAFNLTGCLREWTTDPDHLRQWANALVTRIGMTLYPGPDLRQPVFPFVADFGHADPITAGHTVIIPIETSCIVAHFSDLWQTAYIDVFSCRWFNVHDVFDECTRWLGGNLASVIFMAR